MKKKLTALLLCMLMLAGIFAGCGKTEAATTGTVSSSAGTENTSSASAESSAPADTSSAEETPAEPEYAIEKITIGTTSAIESAIATEYAYEMLSSGVSAMPLVYQDTSGNYHPLLASYSTEDATTWTYTIMPGMTWCDGTPVTAEDIAFTLEYDDANGSANLTEQVSEDGKVTAAKYSGYTISDDKMSISLTLASANVRELSNMTSFRTMPKHILKGNESPTDDDLRISCGPYMFESFNKESGTISFTVNPYYPETPNVAAVEYKLFGNEDTMYMALMQGDIDMVWNYSMGVPATYQEVLAADDGITLDSVSAANEPAVLAFNNAKGPFADINLRKAVSYAINYEEFRSYFGSAFAEIPNTGFVPTTTIGYKETAKLETNTDKAEQYMAEAGYTEKNAKGFYVDADGNQASFVLTVNSNKTTHVGYAELLKTQLDAFGIEVILEAIDGDSYNAKTSNKFSENNITMEAAIYGYTVAGMGMGTGLGSIYVNGNHAVQGGCQVFDEEFTAILSKMSKANNIEEYNKAAAELQDFYAGNTPLVALYWDNMVHGYSAKYENISIDYTFGLNNINNWFTITAK